MSTIRRLIFAALLALSTAPAFAQAPPPVPALPDTERRTAYSINNSTCACAVNFAIYGDNTDYQNWIEVWVNGIEVQYNDPTYGWSISSVTGPLATIPRPITDAVLTFTNSISGTIQIAGARRPRRLAQFSENRGVAARDLNQALTDIVAQNRETWDKVNDVTGRAIVSQPGNTVGNLPLPAACVNALLGFDTSGLNPICVPQSGSGVIALPSVGVFTSNHTIATTDCNSILKMGTGSTYPLTLTLPSTAGFTGPCPIYILGQASRGVKLSGFSNLGLTSPTILWPTKSFAIALVSGAWVVTATDGRWVLPTSEELCWRQDGNDTADGLGNGTVAADCFAHVQTAVTSIGKYWDGGGYNACSVGLYSGGTGIINESVSQTGQSVGCYITVNMRAALTWTNAGPCWTAGDGSIAVFNFNLGFTPILQCNTSNTAASGNFYGHQVVIYDINGSFEWIPGGLNDNLVFMDAQGRATLGLTTLVVGDGNVRAANSLLDCDSHCTGLQISGAVAFSANVTLNQTYALHTQSYILTSASYSGAPTVGAASTPTGNSVLITNGTTIPGGTSTATGGQVCSTKC